MSILRAVHRAYDVAIERKWDVIYWCVDLHGTVLQSTYSNELTILPEAEQALRMISQLPETRITIWSSVYDDDKARIKQLFVDRGIRVDWFNENPEVMSTRTGNFEEKFYFSILVDDKAGFCPSEWGDVMTTARCRSSELTR